MDYVKDGSALTWVKALDTGTAILFKAESISRRASGIHAKVSLLGKAKAGKDFVLLASDLFNVERNEDKTRLANSTFKLLSDKAGDKQVYTAAALKHDLDLFCEGLWAAHLTDLEPQFFAPDTDETEATYLLRPFVMMEAGTFIFAPPGAGKSFLLMLMAVSIDEGCCKLWPCVAGRVLFVNLERSQKSVLKRLSRVNRALGLDPNRKLLMLNARGRSLVDIIEPVRRAVKDHAVDLVVLDSISRAGLGKMVEDQVANSAIDMLNNACPTWVAIAHTPRASDEHAYGSQMFDAGADIMCQLSSQSKDDLLGVQLKITKANDSPTGITQTFALSFNGTGLQSARQAEKYEFPLLLTKGKVDLMDEIKDFILDQSSGKASATDIAKATGHDRSNISTLLNHSPDFMPFKDGHSVLYGLKEKR